MVSVLLGGGVRKCACARGGVSRNQLFHPPKDDYIELESAERRGGRQGTRGHAHPRQMSAASRSKGSEVFVQLCQELIMADVMRVSTTHRRRGSAWCEYI